eukprot:TRINITY_DN398_c0_g1_i1.p1 TRINITY_DN398_c0_g1~~TRINITY_DN398_c0_g1_i1.p1  ORF type:complete len:379 (-),score=41.52 TRINITY_DN398_c0_g1_i1:179-1315(-)
MHYAENRFTCPECKTEQCKNCKVNPYHIGFNCEEWVKNQNAKHCRYCEIVISKANTSAPIALQDICSSPECQEKAKMACQKILPCQHPCAGCINEVKCLDCLNDTCAEQNAALAGQKGTDFCNICFIEGLIQAPSIQLKSCGHIFHYHCILKRLEIRWHRPRIFFTFCLCPLCKKWMEFPAESPLQVKMQENLALFEKIKTMSLQRLKHEDRDKDERLKKEGDPYFNKPMEYAIAIYSYYMCFKCKNPYFGGLKSCEDMMGEEKGKEGFDPKELVCANCCDVTPIENCPKHGKDFIEFKCKFCCSIAQWFCWGTTHFCDPCHKRQASGDYLTKYPKDKLKKCPGKAQCPLKLDHKPNGEECALGCSLCRNMKENQKEF